MILVTGGTGLVGAHLLARLAKENEVVKAIYRSEEKIAATKQVFTYYFETDTSFFDRIEWIKADITDVPSLENAFTDVTHVYHSAALISFDPKDFQKLKKVNIEGTANIVNLCIAFNIEKLCFVSSIAAIGKNEDSTIAITEETNWNSEANNTVYAISKYGAELEVWRGSQEGLDVVIVNPGIILGAGFWNSGSGKLFSELKKGLSFYTTGTFAYVDVVDVVSVMMQLMKNDTKNERFVLVAENWSFKDFTEFTAPLLNAKPPKKEASKLMLSIAWRLDWWRQFFTGKQRRLTKLTAKSLQSTTFYDSAKIKKTLNFTFTPIKESIERVCKRYR